MTRLTAFIILIILAFTALTGCQTIPLKTLQPLEEEGEVLVYLQPFPEEAVSLRFTISAISAIEEDGTEVPLALYRNEFTGRNMTRQRLIASGRLPAGRVSGFLVSAKSAVLTTEEHEEVNLVVPAGPQMQVFPFLVEKKKAVVIALAFKYAESVQAGNQFSPRFTAAIPAKPLDEVTGYVSDRGDNSVVIFDKFKAQATGAVAVGEGPSGMALDSRAKKLYVALSGGDAVDVIDMSTGALFNRIALFRGDAPQALALTPDGQSLIVANSGSDSVSIIDTQSLVERARISVGRQPGATAAELRASPSAVLLDPTGKRAFVFNRLSNTISVIDLSYRAVIATIATGPEPLWGQFNRTGDKLYVIHAQYPYLFIIDPVSFAVLQQQFMGTGIVSLKIDTRTDLLYICRKNDTAIVQYDPFTFLPVGYIPAGGTVEYMTIDNDTNNLYAVVPERKVVMIVNLINRKPVGEIDVPMRPSWVTMMGER